MVGRLGCLLEELTGSVVPIPTHRGTVCLAHSLEGFYLNLPGQQANIV